MMNLDPILSETLDASTKGYPLSYPALAISAIGAQRWSVLDGDLPLPLAVIRDSALAHNHAWMRDFTAPPAAVRGVAASKAVALSGLECYEGLQITGDSGRDEIVVAGLMQRVHDVALACDREGLFAGPSIILTAGGSAAFDIVARDLPMKLSKPVLTILRSGCYVTHDSGFYNRMLEGVKARSGAAWQSRPGLHPALEVWSRVQSCPEPGLAILTMGKRDAAVALEMPSPR